MRKLASVLGVVVVSGTIFAASAEIMTAEEKADLAITEAEIRKVEEADRRLREAVEKAVAIHKRAKERARKAVERSSLMPKLKRVKREYQNFLDGEQLKEPASKVRDRMIFYEKRVSHFIKRMTRIFLDDEIERAEQKKLDGLMQELKKIRKKDYAEI